MGELDSAPRAAAAPRPGTDGATEPVWEAVDREQARDEGADGPAPPAPPRCPRCGRLCDRRPTYYGAYVLLEPGTRRAAHRVPAGHRWYLDPDGRAWKGGDVEPAAGGQCLVPHRVECPALVLVEPAPDPEARPAA
ncbi:DUF6083 domain-containing protein [Streptomyces sp. NPDC006339]|uniref:DUF6083 domain-containing protein n=1 Tax=Streptomyces sp. NPDC006339 TaxID=3156755 RepID=UPI0033BF711F